MSYFQLYEANKAKYKQLKPGSIWRHKRVLEVKIKIISTNWENKTSDVSCITSLLTISQIAHSIENSFILDEYEPCEDSLE